MELGLVEWLVRAGMFVLMLGMGLSLTRADFVRVVWFPKAVVVGSVVQLLFMPLVGLGLALWAGLTPMFAAGLVIVAACPGGTFSNIVVHFGRADTALSVTLTATATFVALLTLPVWVNAILSLVGDGSGAIQVPFVATSLELATFTILPLGLGVGLRSHLRDPTRWERLLSRTGALMVVVALTSQALGEEDETFAGYEQTLPPVFALLGIAAALGYGLPLLLRVGAAQSATIGVETVLKNTVLGIALAELSLGLEAAVPIAIYTVFHMPTSLAILLCYRLWARWKGMPLPGAGEVRAPG